MAVFEQAYKELNNAQRQAVDAVDGPVLVLAGPGTGKTQLLALRVANILRKTDTAAQNILCLTFTESAQATMQKRLVSFLADDAYKVSIHTFHSFASEVIARHTEHFGDQVRSQVADGLASYEILQSIFNSLPYGHPLVVRDGEGFVHLPSVRSRISHAKQAGLQPDELKEILSRDLDWLEKKNALLDEIESSAKPSFRAKHIPLYENFCTALEREHDEIALYGYSSIGEALVSELREALEHSQSLGGKTTPITAWRRKWINTTKTGANLKDLSRIQKLLAFCDIYKTYQAELSKRSLRDFDDLIVNLLAELSKNDDLRASLQEQYQYVLVDEYQDTNGAQQQLIELLSDNPVNEGRPNLMVVGDDDQAIYGFQGANPSYMTKFAERWRSIEAIRLTENYRSTPEILELAKNVIDQATYHHSGDDLLANKELHAAKIPSGPKPELITFPHRISQYLGLADMIKSDIASGVPAEQIAVFGPRHRFLVDAATHLLAQGVPVAYERRDNVLEQPHIIQLLHLAATIEDLSQNNIASAESRLPELLSYPFWGVDFEELWQIQLATKRSDTPWIEQIRSSSEKLQQILNWLITAARSARTETLETMLDIMLGTEILNDWSSPFREYYFSKESLTQRPGEYLSLLSSLKTLTSKVVSFKASEALKLSDLLAYVALAKEAHEHISDSHPVSLSESSVQIMTAHRSKGQEFDVVYLLDCDQAHWVKDKGRSSTLALPANLPIEPEPEDEQEKLRRFYVSLTRAAKVLRLLASQQDDNGKPALPLQWLTPSEVANSLEAVGDTTERTAQLLVPILEPNWKIKVARKALGSSTLPNLLSDSLQNYHLSASHISTFLDLHYAGPSVWLVDKLLHFPKQVSRDAVYGTIIHSVLEHQHIRVIKGESVSKNDAQSDFESQLNKAQLSTHDKELLLSRGKPALEVFLSAASTKFTQTQRAEYQVPKHQVALGDARIYGTIDVIDIDKEHKTIHVIDYKTGRAFDTWSPKEQNHRLKLEGYRRQLIFYKLLLENSREYSGYAVTQGVLRFVEPNEHGDIVELQMDFSADEVANMKALIQNIWQHMMRLDLPQPNDDSPKAIRAFIAELIGENAQLPL